METFVFHSVEVRVQRQQCPPPRGFRKYKVDVSSKDMYVPQVTHPGLEFVDLGLRSLNNACTDRTRFPLAIHTFGTRNTRS